MARHTFRICTLALAAAAVAAPLARSAPAPKPPARLITTDTCVRVVEGDLIEGKKIGLIRLIGVMAPAAGERGYHEAVDTTRRLAIGKAIKVEICPERPNDTQDRVRAVVFLPDGTNLNTKLLRAGTVRLLDRKPCHVETAAWGTYEESARKAKLGLWAEGETGSRSSRSGSGESRPRPRVRIRPAR